MSYVYLFHQKEPINPNSLKSCRGYSNGFHKDAFKELCRLQYQDMGQLLDCTPIFYPHAGQNATSPSSLSGSLLTRIFFFLVVVRQLCRYSLTFMLNIGLLSQKAWGKSLGTSCYICISLSSQGEPSHSRQLSGLPWQFTLTISQKSPQSPWRPCQIDN